MRYDREMKGRGMTTLTRYALAGILAAALSIAGLAAQAPQQSTAGDSKADAITLSAEATLEQENIRLLARVAQLESQLNDAIKALRSQEVDRRVAAFTQRVEKDHGGKAIVDPQTLDVKPKPVDPPKKE